MDFLTYDILFSLITLVFLEIILGIDNLIFITLVVQNLPRKHRQAARVFGLSLALVIRTIMLTALSWVMSLTQPIVQVGELGFSFKDLLLIFGGLFLVGKSGKEIAADVFFKHNSPAEQKFNARSGMFAAIAQIVLVDFVFSFDSIITAVGMTNNIPVMVTAVVISMIVMLLSSEKISYFLRTYPSLKIVALAFIFMIGVILLVDGVHLHISKAYLYFALFFTITVESLNIVARKRHNH
jgi:predicted tellurium resistance membrane protein TerC